MRIERPLGPAVVSLRVYGEPKPAGSKVSGVAYRKGEDGRRVPVERNGKIMTFTKDSSGQAGEGWRNAVAEAGAGVLGGAPLLSGPLYVEITFLLRRPQSHYGSGRNSERLKDSAPVYPAKRPDSTKLLRAVEDALTNVLWLDDSQIVCGGTEKVFAGPDEATGVEVRIWRLPDAISDLGAYTPSIDRTEGVSI